jgi:DNA polymerase/3'-5' exonuclease PolX
MRKNEVNVAFEILFEEIEEMFNILSKEGEEAFKLQDFDKAKQSIENGERLKSFREKVKTLQKEWQTIFRRKNISSNKKKNGKK